MPAKLCRSIPSLSLALTLAATLAACGAGEPAMTTDAAAPQLDAVEQPSEVDATATDEVATDALVADAATGGVDAARADSDTEFSLGPNTYQMVTINGEHAQPKVDEYLDSGYREAAYQLTLFADGSGILYCGRTSHGVLYTANKLIVDGESVSFNPADGYLMVKYGEDVYAFDIAGTPTNERSVNTTYTGRYQSFDGTGKGLDRLRLRDDGSGEYLKNGATKTTKVFWGTDDVLGGDYLLLDGVLHRFVARKQADSDARRYDLVLEDGAQTKYVAVSQYR